MKQFSDWLVILTITLIICRLWFTGPSVDSTRGRHLLLLRKTLSLGRGLRSFIIVIVNNYHNLLLGTTLLLGRGLPSSILGNNFHPVERCLKSFRDHHCEFPCYLWFKVQPLSCTCHRWFSRDWGTIHSVRYKGRAIKKWLNGQNPLKRFWKVP